MSTEKPPLPTKVALHLLPDLLSRAALLGEGDLAAHDEPLDLWFGELQRLLERTFGKGSPEFRDFQGLANSAAEAILFAEGDKYNIRRSYVGRACQLVESFIPLLEAVTAARAPQARSREPSEGNMIFIGHGRSHVWRDLRDLLKDQLNLPVDEFNRVPVAGTHTVERLVEMLDGARFAFLVMTAEDEDNEGRARARQNVVHEVGLFQGRLGFRKAIVLLEEGCEEFSNITGLSQIRFPKGDIMARSEDVRRVLQREGLLSGTGAAF